MATHVGALPVLHIAHVFQYAQRSQELVPVAGCTELHKLYSWLVISR